MSVCLSPKWTITARFCLGIADVAISMTSSPWPRRSANSISERENTPAPLVIRRWNSRASASASASASSGMELHIPSSDSSHLSERMLALVLGEAQSRGGCRQPLLKYAQQGHTPTASRAIQVHGRRDPYIDPCCSRAATWGRMP